MFNPNVKTPNQLPQPSYRLTDQLMQMLDIITFIIDLQFTNLRWDGAIQKVTGYTKNDFITGAIQWNQLIHPEDLPLFITTQQKIIAEQAVSPNLEYRIISGEGKVRWINDIRSLVYDESGKPIAIEGLVIDVTRRKRAEEEFRERQAHLDSILNSVQDVIWSVTPDTFELLYLNPAAERVYGYKLEEIYADKTSGYQMMYGVREMLLENFTTLLQRGWVESEFCFVHPGGEQRWLHRRAHFARDSHGIIARIDGIDADITRRKQAEDSLKYISLHDSLTGLFNRFYFEEKMQQMDSCTANTAGLIICDIDGLKIVNDKMGHPAGDQLLVHCARVLKQSFRSDDIIARIGGDEFTIMITNCTMQDLESATARLRQAIIDYNRLTELPFPLCMSIGMAFKSSPEISMNQVFRQADNLMYTEKPSNHRKFESMFAKINGSKKQGDGCSVS